MNSSTNNEKKIFGVKSVWKRDLERAFREIRRIVDLRDCNHIAISSTPFSAVCDPISECNSEMDFQYQLIRCNANDLNIIQLGLSFMDENGEPKPYAVQTYQFNFKFNLGEDFLQNSKMKKYVEDAIDPFEFSKHLKASGLMLMDDITWLGFNSSYDFAFMLRLLTNRNLPADFSQFHRLLRQNFPTFFDMKYVMECNNMKGGLQAVAEQLKIKRVGSKIIAAGNAYLTGLTFFEMKETIVGHNQQYCGHLYGLE